MRPQAVPDLGRGDEWGARAREVAKMAQLVQMLKKETRKLLLCVKLQMESPQMFLQTETIKTFPGSSWAPPAGAAGT